MRPLTDIQLAVLCWVAGGATFDQIAAETEMSLTGVKQCVRGIQAKLGARNSPHMVAIAYQRRILAIETPGGPS